MAFLPTIRPTLRRSLGEASKVLQIVTHPCAEWENRVGRSPLHSLCRDRVADERTKKRNTNTLKNTVKKMILAPFFPLFQVFGLPN